MSPIDAHELERKVEPDEYYHSNEVKAMIEDTPTIDKPPNPPLTLEELRGMDGEPVWVVSIDPLWPFDPCWMLVSGKTEILRDVNTEWLDFRRYGKTWLAYRRKRSEGTT